MNLSTLSRKVFEETYKIIQYYLFLARNNCQTRTKNAIFSTAAKYGMITL